MNLFSMASKWEDLLEFQLKAMKLSGFIREYQFHPKRKWRFDFVNLMRKLAIECEGGIYTNGRHTRPKGFENDCQKYNEATLMGFRVLRFTPAMIKSGKAIEYVMRSI